MPFNSESLFPHVSELKDDTISEYVKGIIDCISEVRNLIYVMLKSDEGMFMRQLTDLIFGQFLTNALSFFDIKDSEELRLYYEFLSAGVAAFIIKWIPDANITEDKALKLLTDILLQTSTKPHTL